MKISTLLRKLSVFMMICALGLPVSSAFSQEKGKAKAKGKEKTETKRPRQTENMVVQPANCLTVLSIALRQKANFHQAYKRRRTRMVN